MLLKWTPTSALDIPLRAQKDQFSWPGATQLPSWKGTVPSLPLPRPCDCCRWLHSVIEPEWFEYICIYWCNGYVFLGQAQYIICVLDRVSCRWFFPCCILTHSGSSCTKFICIFLTHCMEASLMISHQDLPVLFLKHFKISITISENSFILIAIIKNTLLWIFFFCMFKVLR